ncbi:MAG: PTS sugar transporter subunit IIB [Treponema sp.]|jgi:PTS system cellobiose-specific IIB component|nr:PTS sugar transporter subunit IIB [Treponema sp.]
MGKLNILLICGSGASTGFMAANMRKEAAKQGLDWEITARSEGEVENYVDEANCIMVGPHLAYLVDELMERYKNRDIKIALMNKSYYSTLNGAAALKHIQSLY